MTEQARLKNTVYVGGLASIVDSNNLHAAFIPFGEIVDISLPKPEAPSSTELHRGFGYVEFEDPADAKEAIDNMDQAELFGRVIKVSAAKPQKNANEGLGSKTAVWEQVSLFSLFYSVLVITNIQQESWLAENAVSEEDKLAGDRAKAGTDDRPYDPMQGLEGLDVAGPKPA
jgi:RNA recognition motif-containing protein